MYVIDISYKKYVILKYKKYNFWVLNIININNDFH